jgi:hypothetical protein
VTISRDGSSFRPVSPRPVRVPGAKSEPCDAQLVAAEQRVRTRRNVVGLMAPVSMCLQRRRKWSSWADGLEPPDEASR